MTGRSGAARSRPSSSTPASNRSFNVEVGGVTAKERGGAVAAARKVIESELETYGDVDREELAKIT